jgi:ribonuclease T1
VSLVAILAVVAVLGWWLYEDTDAGSTGRVPPAVTSSIDAPDVETGDVDPDSGLPFVELADLPSEAIDTLELIEAGGPYPYDQDGVTFENREGLLPDQPTGYYAEFTVETPGEDDRGARRIVTGEGGEYFYTDDHYDSFSRIAQ